MDIVTSIIALASIVIFVVQGLFPFCFVRIAIILNESGFQMTSLGF